MMPRWVQGMDEQQTKEMKAEYENSVLMRERLTQMIEKDIDESLIKMRAFAEKQQNLTEMYAAELAKQKAMLDIVKLIR